MKVEDSSQPEEGMNGLTGLLRREFFMNELFADFDSSVEDGVTDYSFIMLDTDDFKSVNDLDGSAQGDNVLEGVGNIIKTIYHEGVAVGTSCRYGGEEFLLALRGVSQERALEIAEALCIEIRDYSYVDAKTNAVGYGRQVTASLGVASLNLSELQSEGPEQRCSALENAIGKSEVATKFAKFKGKNRAVSYSEEVGEEMDNVKNVRAFYFENVFNPEMIMAHPFMQSNPDLRASFKAHCEFARQDLTPKDTRILARLADNLYSAVFDDTGRKKEFLDFIQAFH